jgi:hypothetical protein
MTQPWTAESILALAPDQESAKAGQGLSSPKQWENLGRDEIALWGEIRGSGSKPYQTRIDLREPAFKCSCPSRKFPCKHGLGLLLAFAKDASAFPSSTAPDWVAEWLSTRSERAERRVERAAAQPTPDPAAQARRAEQREAKVDAGLEQLHVWLLDLVRSGFAHAQLQPAGFWDSMSARLVDAQASGLARLVRELESLAHSGPGFEGRLLHAVARIELVRAAFARRASLPQDLVDELRAVIGWSVREDDVLARSESVADSWFVLGTSVETEDRLRVRRTWLRGRQSGRHALVLDFAVGAQPLGPGAVPGTQVEGELAFYPGTLELRAAFKSRSNVRAGEGRMPGGGIAAELDAHAHALARAPWLERWPMALAEVRVIRQSHDGRDRWFVVDGSKHALALNPGVGGAWALLAVSGGGPIDLFGEWNGHELKPLAIGRGSDFYGCDGAATPTREGTAA